MIDLITPIVQFIGSYGGDISLTILVIAIFSFYYKRVKPFLDALPDTKDLENNKKYMDLKTKEIIENITDIKNLIDKLKRDIEYIDGNIVKGEKELHNRINNIITEVNQISNRLETMMFLSIKGELK